MRCILVRCILVEKCRKWWSRLLWKDSAHCFRGFLLSLEKCRERGRSLTPLIKACCPAENFMDVAEILWLTQPVCRPYHLTMTRLYIRRPWKTHQRRIGAIALRLTNTHRRHADIPPSRSRKSQLRRTRSTSREWRNSSERVPSSRGLAGFGTHIYVAGVSTHLIGLWVMMEMSRTTVTLFTTSLVNMQIHKLYVKC